MNRTAILHIPLSQYAFAESESRLTIRLRAARNDLSECVLYYGDRVCEDTRVVFTAVPMELVAEDIDFDYYEAAFDSPYQRVCYYFYLKSGVDEVYYYADSFHEGLADITIDGKIMESRSEYYQYPFILRDEVPRMPEWFKQAAVYNIFPDSFADEQKHIAGRPEELENGRAAKSHSRLGGTINGITLNLDYIQEMGFDCIYLNPVFIAGEWHKYDVLDYYHIDPCLGTDEDFKRLVDEVHRRGMHIVIDGVFNHCSWYFFAFEDVVRKGKASAYSEWFYDLQFPVSRPEAEGERPCYCCFAYEKKMPKLNTSNEEVQEYFEQVGRYWIREFKVDGWRLDVANEIDRGFWRRFRSAVKQENPEAVLIGEVWENSETWLRGDAFDSTMNYDFRRIMRDYLALDRLDARGVAGELTDMLLRYTKPVSQVQLNLLNSHDVPRFISLCGKERANARYRQALVVLMTFFGVPCIFYGDELALGGVTELEYRRPMEWERLETAGSENEQTDLRDFISRLIAIRKKYIEASAPVRIIQEETDRGVFAYRRTGAEYTVTAYLNTAQAPAMLLKGENAKRVVIGNVTDGCLPAETGYAVAVE